MNELDITRQDIYVCTRQLEQDGISTLERDNQNLQDIYACTR